MSERIRLGVVGAGLIGTRRAQAAVKSARFECAGVVDANDEAARKLAADCGVDVFGSTERLIDRATPDAVVVATVHKSAPGIALTVLDAGCHLLMEKPMGRNLPEADTILARVADGQKVCVGLNYRYLRNVQRALALVEEGRIGEPRHMRLMVGHGARHGCEHSWKTDRDLCGGGTLLDPGVHLIDLAHLFLGTATRVRAMTATHFWPIEVEDHAVASIEFASGSTAVVQANIATWKNTFSVDVVGPEGMIRLTGRGGSYGPMRLEYYQRGFFERPDVPDVKSEHDFGADDVSLADELEDFGRTIQGEQPVGRLSSPPDGWRALAVVETAYSGREEIPQLP